VKAPLKVGDRVRVYSHYGPYTGTVHSTGAEILSPYGGAATGMINVLSESGEIWTQHPKQCRRLKKRKPREWFIWIDENTGRPAPPRLSEGALTQIKVREVRTDVSEKESNRVMP
jgi:hypothetical protein